MRANPNPLYRQSFLAVLPIAIVSPVLGMAEGALADFLAMAGIRTTRGAVAGGNRRMAELTTVQMRVAEASALIDAARLLMARDLAEALASATRGEPISIEVRLRNRRDQAFCVRLLVQAIDALFLAAGGQGLFLDQPLQRTWRDAHAAASHISLNWDFDRQHVRAAHARPGAEGPVLSSTPSLAGPSLFFARRMDCRRPGNDRRCWISTRNALPDVFPEKLERASERDLGRRRLIVGTRVAVEPVPARIDMDRYVRPCLPDLSTSPSGMLASISPKCSMVGTFGTSCARATIWLP